MFTIVARLIFIVNKFFNADRAFSYAELSKFWCVHASIWGARKICKMDRFEDSRGASNDASAL